MLPLEDPQGLNVIGTKNGTKKIENWSTIFWMHQKIQKTLYSCNVLGYYSSKLYP